MLRKQTRSVRCPRRKSKAKKRGGTIGGGSASDALDATADGSFDAGQVDEATAAMQALLAEEDALQAKNLKQNQKVNKAKASVPAKAAPEPESESESESEDESSDEDSFMTRMASSQAASARAASKSSTNAHAQPSSAALAESELESATKALEKKERLKKRLAAQEKARRKRLGDVMTAMEAEDAGDEEQAGAPQAADTLQQQQQRHQSHQQQQSKAHPSAGGKGKSAEDPASFELRFRDAFYKGQEALKDQKYADAMAAAELCVGLLGLSELLGRSPPRPQRGRETTDAAIASRTPDELRAKLGGSAFRCLLACRAMGETHKSIQYWTVASGLLKRQAEPLDCVDAQQGVPQPRVSGL